MIELRGVSKIFRLGDIEVVALANINLTIRDGELVACVGPSGSGKSTLLNLLGLLDTPTEGQVFLDNQDVTRLSEGERERLRLSRIGFIFQRFHLMSQFTALENVAIPLEALGVSVRGQFQRSRELLVQAGLGDRVDFPPSRMSGGERQRVAICRALANRPGLLLADEPTGELHSEDKARILKLFEELHTQGSSILIVTHDEQTAAITHRRIELRDGRISKDVRQ